MIYDPLMRAYFPGFPEVFFLVFVLAGCEIDGSDNLPRVPDQGLFMLADANRHDGDDSAQVAAAVFSDGEPVNLVGGDLFEARTVTERVLLKQGGPVTGSYAASLPVDDSVQDVFLNVCLLYTSDAADDSVLV